MAHLNLTHLNEWLSLILLLSLVAGLVRVWRGPTAADRMLSAQLFGTTGIAILLLLAEIGHDALRHIALVLALLALMATTAFASRGWKGTAESATEKQQEESP